MRRRRPRDGRERHSRARCISARARRWPTPARRQVVQGAQLRSAPRLLTAVSISERNSSSWAWTSAGRRRPRLDGAHRPARGGNPCGRLVRRAEERRAAAPAGAAGRRACRRRARRRRRRRASASPGDRGAPHAPARAGKASTRPPSRRAASRARMRAALPCRAPRRRKARRRPRRQRRSRSSLQRCDARVEAIRGSRRSARCAAVDLGIGADAIGLAVGREQRQQLDEIGRQVRRRS